MCGIAGLFRLERNYEIQQEQLVKMADPIHHRGPDGSGYFSNDRVGFAHRRLSIIDLEGGDQPMFNQTGEIGVIFNGEIYNYVELKEQLEKLGHKFLTQSDTEVIIKGYEEWGVDCQKKLNGMWAFALWDEKKQQLLVSRDRLGEKPLNYAISNGTFVFGSEIKSILAYTGPLEPEMDLLQIYLFLGFIPAPYTFYRSVFKLPAGKYLIVKDQEVREHTYWDLPDINEGDLLHDETEICRQLEELLYDSVSMRMRSDVPFGAFLSGGLDSSCIVSLMSEVSAYPIKTFTIGFEEKGYDERAMAKIVADRFKTEHHEHLVNRSSYSESLKNILFHYDEPFADPAAIPTAYLAESAAKQVKMVLTGDGGDEVFAGYSNYQSERFAQMYKDRAPNFLQGGLPKLIKSASPFFSGQFRYGLNRMQRVFDAMDMPFEKRLITKFIKISTEETKSLAFNKYMPIEEFITSALKGCSLKDPFYKLNYFNLKVSLPEQMMNKVDKMSMAYSLETRAPLLDHRIVELMYRVDKSLKMPTYRNSGVKHVLKKTMKSRLPEVIVQRQKKGFEVPLREWFKGREFDQALDLDFSSSGLNMALIKQLITENKSGKADHGKLLWRLVIFHTWLEQQVSALKLA